MSNPVEVIIHTPPNSGPHAMVLALIEGIQESKADDRVWQFAHHSGDHGAEAMRMLLAGAGRADLISTCTPSFLQTPLLEGMEFSFHDLTPLAQLVADRYLLVAPAASYATAEALIEDMRARPTRTGGYLKGGNNQLLALAMEEAFGTQPADYLLVGSAAEIVPAMLDGRIEWGVGTPGEVSKALADGSLKALAVFAPERLEKFPNVPTLAEVGAPIEITLWRGLMCPPGLGAGVLNALEGIIQTATQTQAWNAYLEKAALSYVFAGSAAFNTLLERENEWYRKQFTRAGLLTETPAVS